MIKAILLDLDNTLLKNPDHTFALTYLSIAEAFFRERWGIQDVAQLFVQSIKAMSNHRDMHTSNTMLRATLLANKTQHPLEKVNADLSTFYESMFPDLRPCVEPIPGVRAVVDDFINRDYAVVIATNPLYPAIAIQQKLIWAGLSPNLDDYAFVTTADNMHYVKPDPAYYAEILARIGIEPDETVMVGDSTRNDLHPAQQLNIHTYHITAPDDATQGSIKHFHQISTQQPSWFDSLHPHNLKIQMIAPQLQGNVGALFGLLDQVQDDFWQQHPDPEEWSILQIVCHLLESEGHVQRPRLQTILNDDSPFLASPKAPPGPASQPCDDDGYRVAKKFLTERQKTLAFLEQLQTSDWTRPARHSIFGPTSLLEMAHFTAQHDRLHLNQLCQTIGNCE